MNHSANLAKILAFLLLLTFTLNLSACGSNGGSEKIDSSLPIKVTVLNGTTGFGIAKLMKDAKNGNATLHYTFNVEADASNVMAALINGSTDIAALPTNAAATVYNKTNGAVQVLALNTLGVLYVVSNGEAHTITDLESLRGKTVFCPASNPSVIFSALCHANGLTVGSDIFVDTTYAEPAAVRDALATGAIDLAVLPEPMVTIAKSKNAKLDVSLDLTAEWDKSFKTGSLVQGCIVIRKAFAEEHPNEVARFLTEYKASINYMKENVSDAAKMIVEEGIFAGTPLVAAAAIPRCNATFVTGDAMKASLSGFLEVLHSLAPNSIGGALPQSDFYYGAA